MTEDTSATGNPVPQYAADAWAEWQRQSMTRLADWSRLTRLQQEKFTAAVNVAVTAELAKALDGYARLCREFTAHAQSGQTARIGLTVLNRHRVLARLAPLPHGGEKHNPYIDLDAENDRLRALLQDIIRVAAHPGAVVALAAQGLEPQS